MCEKLFNTIKERVETREDNNSENRNNKIKGLTGFKIFQKTFTKYLSGVSYQNALIEINKDIDSYLKWLDNYPIEMLLASKSKPGYKKLKQYFHDGIFIEDENVLLNGEIHKNRGTQYYINKLK